MKRKIEKKNSKSSFFLFESKKKGEDTYSYVRKKWCAKKNTPIFSLLTYTKKVIHQRRDR